MPVLTSSGRKREDDELLFTAALVEELDHLQERHGLHQRALADRLDVNESLLSMYRGGQRLPSITGCLMIEREFPGFMLRLVQGYYRQVARRDRAPRDEADDERERPVPPGPRVGLYPLATLVG